MSHCAPWINEANRPFGLMGRAAITASQAGITTVTDVTGLSVTFTALANRWYRLSAEVYVSSSVNADVAAISITDASNAQIQSGQALCPAGVGTVKLTCSDVINTTAGSKTYKVRASRASGTGTISIFAAATARATLTVEDLGPV